MPGSVTSVVSSFLAVLQTHFSLPEIFMFLFEECRIINVFLAFSSTGFVTSTTTTTTTTTTTNK
jgi:hypothetical protein